jgi:small subunit ribosomal protein S3
VANPSFNAQIMAERLANALERGWYFRKAGTSILRRVMDSGALGCQVIIAGKLTGARARTQKFTEGYIKHCGEPSNTIVEKGYAVAIKKLGVIGVQVKIVPAGAKLPDHFEIIEQEKPKAAQKGVVVNVGSDADNEPALPDDIDHVEGR